MKSLLKFSLLSALIITGKLVKQSSMVATTHAVETKAARSISDNSIVLVHQVLTTESVKAARERELQRRQQAGTGLLAELF